MINGMPIRVNLSAALLCLSILGLSLLGLAARAEAAGACPAARQPAKVSVTALLPPPPESFITSYHDLSKQTLLRKLKPTEDAMGVSSSRLGYEGAPTFKIVSHGGTQCYYLTSLKLQFGYVRRMIQIASEVPQGSCMFKEIREHEYKHVTVDNAIVTDNLALVTSALQGFVASYGPIEAADSNAAEAQFNTALKSALKPTISHLYDLTEAAQEKVDTDAEYARVDDACRVHVDTSKTAAAPVAAPSQPAVPPMHPDGKN
jgi:hypothetical protein